jgi:hypothetical protein
MGVRWSCLVHGLLLLLLLGCHVHPPVSTPVAPDAEIADAKQFAQAVGDKMPLWDADAISRYERVEIAAVKADVIATLQEDARGAVLEDAARLHEDWNALLALDELLKHQSLI